MTVSVIAKIRVRSLDDRPRQQTGPREDSSGNVYVSVDGYVDEEITAVKTTVRLREDVRDHLLRKVGPRHLSEAINDILAKALFSQKKSLFGADPWLDTKGLRDEQDAQQDP